MWQRILEIVRKELKQTLREPRMRAMLFAPPIIQMLIFGFAVNLDVENAKVVWADMDQGWAARELRAAFDGSPQFTVVANAQTEAEAQNYLDRSEADAIIRVPPAFTKDLDRGRAAEVQILVDGTNSNTASLVASQAAQVVNRFTQDRLRTLQRQKLVGRAVDRPIAIRLPRVVPETHAWFNPDLRSRRYFVPGIIVNIIMLVTLTLTSMAIVREKEIGTMEQLMVTPIRPYELILGKTLPFAAIGLVQVAFVTVLAMVIFGIPLRGSPLLLGFTSLLFIICSLGLGLFISTISNTQQQAMMSTLFIFQPLFMLSGFSFPIANMPTVIQWSTYINPMRYFMEITRGLFLKGVGLEVLWPQTLALAVLGFAILGFSVLRFHKRLD
ncbi:MAG: ABC transporter permease [Bryobacter sp.]|nr:ABC transporter permease [Bryobacter sp.]